MLSCVCSVIDNWWRQNVVRTKKWHTRRYRVCHWCCYHILTSSVIYLLNWRTATWNLFVLYNKETNYCSFFISKLESRPLPTSEPTIKAIWRNLSSKWKWISLVAMRSKIIVIGPGKSRHRQLDLNGFPWNENLYITAKTELNCEIHKS